MFDLIRLLTKLNYNAFEKDVTGYKQVSSVTFMPTALIQSINRFAQKANKGKVIDPHSRIIVFVWVLKAPLPPQQLHE